MLVNTGVKVFDVVIGKVRCFEFADIEFEAIDGVE